MSNTLVPERLVVIGASAGGFSAWRHLLGALEPDFNWPIVIVLHIGSSDIDHLVDVLAATSALPVIEARPGAAPRPGTEHVAPGDRQRVMSGNGVAARVALGGSRLIKKYRERTNRGGSERREVGDRRNERY